MRAAVITPEGPDGSLEICEAPDPEPGAGQVLVKVRAAGLNRADLLARAGRYPVASTGPPIPGMEIAGVVIAAAADVAHLRPGDPVMAMCTSGYAELVTVDAKQAMPVPEGLAWEDAAALPVGCMTELDAIVNAASFVPGESVLVSGAGSGVGLLGLAIARALGAGPVYGSARSQRSRTAAAEAGASKTFDLADPETMLSEVGPDSPVGGIDIIIDHVGGDTLGPHLSVLDLGGRLISVGRLGGKDATVDLNRLALRRLRMVGTTFRTRSATERAAIADQVRASLTVPIASGAVRAQVGRVYTLDQALDAQEDLRACRHRGKLILRMDS